MSTRVRALLADRARFVAGWIDRYDRSLMRLPRQIDPAALEQLVGPLLDRVLEASADGPEGPDLPAPGSPGLRDLEKSLGFVAAQMTAGGSTAFDVAALVYALRDSLLAGGGDPVSTGRLADWLGALAAEAAASARADGVRERHREELEEGMPLVLIAPELPALLLVGSPDSLLLDSQLGRLLLAGIRVGAKAAIIDASGLTNPVAEGTLAALGRYLGHRKVVANLEVIAVGLEEPGLDAWRTVAASAGAKLVVAERFDDAVREGLARAGLQIVPKRSP